MITKLLIVSLCIVVGTTSGLYFSKKLINRADYFTSVVTLINHFICEVKFRKPTTKQILNDFINNNNSLLNQHLSEYILCEHIAELKLSKSILTQKENDEVQKLLCSLGTLDTQTQVFELENFKLTFTEFAVCANEKKAKFASMYIKLGFFFGLALGIILI